MAFRNLYFILGVIALLLAGCSPKQDTLTINGRTMGTFYSVRISITESDTVAGRTSLELQTSIDSILNEVNRQMSTYLEESEITGFNRFTDTTYYPVSADFAYVVNEALKISTLSGGAFDITIGSLVDLWGFGSKGRITKAPSEDSIAIIKQQTGYEKLSVRLNPPAIKKSEPAIEISLAAIAKGFGVDKIADFLSSLSYSNFLVEIGGEIRVSGNNHHGEKWKIGIAAPDGEGEIHKIISLSSGALATSGDYHNYFEENGIRYSHTIDPQTGFPISHNLASVTVIAETCTFADAFATALDVLGPEKGLQLANQQSIPVFMIVYSEAGFEEVVNSYFESLFHKEM